VDGTTAMVYAFVILAMLLPFLMGAAFLLGRLQRRRSGFHDLSPVTRQHIELFQGGQLSEAAVESAKLRFRSLLERGEVEAIEASLQPGMHFVVHVRALAELGTDDAGRILEKQLGRKLTEDQLEQSWYWIDVASGLRALNREQSLPHLLRCAETAGDAPLGHFLAAETVCFLGFSGYLRQPESPLGQAALRVLHRTLDGVRHGVLQPLIVVESRLGEIVESLWDHRADGVSPLGIRVYVEALRLLRRAPHLEALLGDESTDREAFRWQISRLAAIHDVLDDYLCDAAELLCDQLRQARGPALRDLLQALLDLRGESAPGVLPLLQTSRCAYVDLAVETLAWSRDPRVGPWLRDWAIRHVSIVKRAQRRRRAMAPPYRSVSPKFPYRSVLRALRGHGSRETEAFLLLAARDWDPTYRAAALGSLGWWEPLHRREVLHTLQEARHDPNPEVRHAARSALARLGEVHALDWFRQNLASDDHQRVFETIQLIANESIAMLFPDLDELADSEDAELAFQARDALEQLSEEMDGHK
jgi:hypothetical protein